MPRNTGRRPHPFDLRHEVTLSVLPAVLIAAGMTAVAWVVVFHASPMPTWAVVVANAGAFTAAAAVAWSVALGCTGRSRRLWKAAMIVPCALLAGAFALLPAFTRFALVHHGVDVECMVVSRQGYLKGEDDEPMTAHTLQCGEWGSVSHSTYRDEQYASSEVRVVVFDPLGRVDPDFGDPSAAEGASFVLLSALFLTGGVAARLFIVDDGTVVRGIGRNFGRVRRRLMS